MKFGPKKIKQANVMKKMKNNNIITMFLPLAHVIYVSWEVI